MKPALVWSAFTCLLALTSVSALAADEPSMDESFQQARELAYSGQRIEARKICEEILEDHPDAVEVKTLLGRTYAWDKDYDKAREVLQDALADKPSDLDARSALIDVELWSGHPEAARDLATEGLDHHPDSGDLLFRRARSLYSLGETREALSAVEQAVGADPENREAVKLYRRLLGQMLPNKIGVDFGMEWFDDGTDPWQQGRIAYRRYMSWGSLVGRLNLARRFGKNGSQFEVDAYPDVAANTYAYLNVGVSSGGLFPELRYGAELFHNFKGGWEGSLGFRRLDFESNGVTIYTGSVSKYQGKYWIELRPQYVTKLSGRSFSGRVRVRRFFNDRFEFIELSAGTGSGSDRDLVVEPADLISRSIRFEYRRRLKHRLIFKVIVGAGSEDLDATRNRDSVFATVGFDKLF
jgi:YaiO family outer membrane protein